MHRSKLPYFFLALAAVLTLTAVALLVMRSGILDQPTAPQRPGAAPASALVVPVPQPAAVPPSQAVPDPAKPSPSKDPAQPKPPQDPATPGTKPAAAIPVVPVAPVIPPAPAAAQADPAQLVADIAKTLAAGDFDGLARLLGKDVCDAKTLEQLKLLATSHPLKIDQPNAIREVGELELNALSRWSIPLAGGDPAHDRILLDLRNTDGKWSVAKLILPPLPGQPNAPAPLTDSLDVADAFLQAVLSQNFERARTYVDSKTLSDAKIAGLCILFEEGHYQLRRDKPLRALFQRGDTAGFLANVLTTDASQTAQFALTLRLPQAPAPANWLIAEINLDQLLADYARRVAGGDIYYSPLVKNPQGGDTLALYFEFDEDQINPRTRRQLEIVTQILRTDPGKKITLSGHTDALGTDPYNNQLSARRADTVRDFLAAAGVSPTQIVTLAKGASQPRRPNVTPAGADDPAGRRANRRTEIYLDF
jgi:OOP family OmpA-OmpF porin